MTRDLFGLNVECSDAQVEDFTRLRSILEPVIRSCIRKLSEVPHSSIDCNFVKVPGNNPFYLSFCMVDKRIILALYDKNKQTLSDTCDYNDIKSLGMSEMNRLGAIIENYMKTKRKLPNLNALDSAWKEALSKLKQKEADKGSPDKKGSTLDDVLKEAIQRRAPPVEISKNRTRPLEGR